MKNFFKKVRYKLYYLLRAIYIRIGILRAMRHRYLHGRLRAAEKMAGLWNSSDNRPALQALSARRFDESAVLAATGVAEPAAWPQIDVSVVTYNSARWVAQFITSLFAQRYPLAQIHLRFVDHGSRDGTVVQLEKLLAESGARFASARVIRQANLGFGAGHDRAIREGQSAYCLVTNLDLEFASDSLCNTLRMALADTEATVASWELRQIPYEHPKYYDPVTLETNWSSHACILMRRSAYEKVGGYDPEIFMYAEDVELSYRFRSHGYALKYLPGAVVHHYTYESAAQVKPMQHTGSAIGNLYIRLRYGQDTDRLAGWLLYAARFIRPSPFAGAKWMLLKNAFRLLPRYAHFRRGKGQELACFPLRAYDYEMTRDGAFWEVQPVPLAAAPLVTVMTRTYKGRGMFLQQAMQSVFNQTYPAIELLVVEDGGDSQQALVTALSARAPAGCRVRFLPNAKLGRSAAGNVALAAAEGQYLMFLDDDDLLFSDHVETLVATLSRDAGLSAAYALSTEVHTRVDPSGENYVETAFDTPAIFRQEWDYETLLDHNFIPIQAILFKQVLFKKRGGFDTGLDQLEDWSLWLRYGYGNRFAYVPKTTSLFRSPADYDKRAARFGMLHAAYDIAKERARGDLKRLGLLQ